jgi:hypothetical protein
MTPEDIPCGVVVCAARLGTNDLDATVEDWASAKIPVWGVVPERVAIAAGPAARISREGLEVYQEVLRRVLRAARR